jgi:hypothetical protein
MSTRQRVKIENFQCECESGSEEKITRVIALALTLALFSVPGAGLEPAQPLWSQDFKSCVSTIPPSGRFLVVQIYNK